MPGSSQRGHRWAPSCHLSNINPGRKGRRPSAQPCFHALLPRISASEHNPALVRHATNPRPQTMVRRWLISLGLVLFINHDLRHGEDAGDIWGTESGLMGCQCLEGTCCPRPPLELGWGHHQPLPCALGMGRGKGTPHFHPSDGVQGPWPGAGCTGAELKGIEVK